MPSIDPQVITAVIAGAVSLIVSSIIAAWTQRKNTGIGL